MTLPFAGLNELRGKVVDGPGPSKMPGWRATRNEDINRSLAFPVGGPHTRSFRQSRPPLASVILSQPGRTGDPGRVHVAQTGRTPRASRQGLAYPSRRYGSNHSSPSLIRARTLHNLEPRSSTRTGGSPVPRAGLLETTPRHDRSPIHSPPRSLPGPGVCRPCRLRAEAAAGRPTRVSLHSRQQAGGPRGHRLRGLHRPDRGGPVGGRPAADDRLPGGDAVQGRGGGQEGRPALRDRPAAVPGPVRPGEGAGQPLPGPAQAGPDDLCPRPGDQQPHPGRRQPAAARPGRGRGRGGRGPGQGLREEPARSTGSTRNSPGSSRRSTAWSAATT